MRILGVDPGHKDVALVVRDGDQLIHSESLTRSGHTLEQWLIWCAGRTLGVIAKHGVEAAGVEGVNAPNPHVGRRDKNGEDRGPQFIDPEPVIEAAMCAAAIYATVAASLQRIPVVLVEPAGFGAPLPSRRHLLAAYPVELVGPREKTGAGKSTWQHLRSAFDCAGAVPRLLRARDAEGTAGAVGLRAARRALEAGTR